MIAVINGILFPKRVTSVLCSNLEGTKKIRLFENNIMNDNKFVIVV